MPSTRLTLGGGFARLPTEWPGKRRPRMGKLAVSPGVWVGRLGIAAFLAGCATITPSSPAEQKEKVVAERAQARWDVLIKGDVGAAYQFLSAGSKAATSAELYKAKIRPGLWRQARVDKVGCEGEVCKVTMLGTYDAKRMKGIETPVAETWIIENGSAWYVYR